jgi:hypothetical protein
MSKNFTPGEEVWVVERDEAENATGVAGFVFLAEVEGAVIVSPYINGRRDLEDLLEYHIEETAENYDTDLSVFPSRDCFGIREEAKDAYKAEVNA